MFPDYFSRRRRPASTPSMYTNNLRATGVLRDWNILLNNFVASLMTLMICGRLGSGRRGS